MKELHDQKDQQSSKLLDKITLRLQTLFSIQPKIDEKLANLLIKFISPEHIKNILEERDCNSFCGNFLCDKVLKKDKDGRLFYNPETKKFTKEDIYTFFCNVKCFQSFKDFCKVAETFDYLYLSSPSSAVIFNILIDYFPNNKYLKQISDIAKEIIDININQADFKTLNIKTREYLNTLFIEDLDKYLNFDDITIKEETINVSNLFEVKKEDEIIKEQEQKNFTVVIKTNK